jgi:hypothetical protein
MVPVAEACTVHTKKTETRTTFDIYTPFIVIYPFTLYLSLSSKLVPLLHTVTRCVLETALGL